MEAPRGRRGEPPGRKRSSGGSAGLDIALVLVPVIYWLFGRGVIFSSLLDTRLVGARPRLLPAQRPLFVTVQPPSSPG
jgi:hypothetical protein